MAAKNQVLRFFGDDIESHHILLVLLITIYSPQYYSILLSCTLCEILRGPATLSVLPFC